MFQSKVNNNKDISNMFYVVYVRRLCLVQMKLSFEIRSAS